MFTRRRSARQKAPTLTRQLVMLAVFFGLMLTPVMSSMATAFEADRAQALAQGDEATEPVDDGTDTGEDPSDTGDEALIVEATEVPADVPTEVMVETGMVTVWKAECPIENFDPYQASADQLSSTCSPNGTANFQVTDTSGGSPQSGPSGSSFDVLAGSVSIGEDLPAGYQQPVVVCQSDMSGVSQPSVNSAAVSIQVNSEEMVVCTFYNVPGASSTLWIYKWSCPSGYDFMAANADPKMDCTTGQNGVNFTLTDTDPQTSDTQTMTGDSTQYAVMFGGIPAGSYTVTETVPDGYGDPFVWDCMSEPGQNGAIPTSPLASGNVLTLDVANGTTVTCNWYNVPDGNEVTIYKWDCPVGTDNTGTEEYLLTECNTQHTGIPFDLSDANGSHPMDSQSDGTTWNDVVRGTEDVTVTETIPDGYGDPVVYCYSLLPDETDSAMVTSTGGTVAIPNLGDNQWNYYCNWFNIPAGGTYDGDTGAIEIEYRECADGYAFLDGTNENDLDQMLLDCARVDGVAFTIDQGGPDGTTQETGFYGESHVSFLEVPVGMRTVTQTMPFANTYVVCEGIVSNGGPETGVMVMPVANGSIQWNLINEEIAYCSWFVMPDGDGNEVTVYKWDCPAGTDPSGTLEYFGAECDTEHLNIPITLTDDGGPHATTTQANGTTWNDVVAETGSFTISEDLPAGYGDPVVYCYMLLPDETESALVPSTGGTITPNVPVDVQWNYYCNWYNIPVEYDTYVYITKWECTQGYVADVNDIAGLAQNCTTTMEGVDFGAVPGGSGTTDASGEVALSIPYDAEITVTESLPAGYGTPIVRCTVLESETDALVSDIGGMPISNGSSITLPAVAEGGYVVCDWFNVYAEYTDLIIYKWTCPDAYDPYGPGADPLMDCTAGPDGVTFNTEGPNGYTSQTDTGDSIQYAVMFGGLEAGLYTITETPPDGYTGMVWDCSEGATYGGGTNNMMTLEAMGGEVTCNWLNIPDYDHHVIMYKWICPDGTVASDHDQEWFFENCTQSTDDVQFRIDHNEGSEYAYPAGGMIDWSGVPAGPIGIQEYVPADYENPVVYCSIIDGPWEMYPVNSGFWSYGTFGENGEGPYTFTCHVFNIYGGPGEITVYKWTCPEGYDPHAWGIDPYADCVEGPNGITFTNDGPDGYSSQTDTGDSIDYAVYWGGLEPGTYTVEELVPDGIGSVFVWDCYGQRMGELRPTPLTTAPSVTLDLHAGEQIVCHWFNVPEDPHGKLTVIKFECATKTWVSEVDCEVYEGGQTFDLAQWNGSAWGVIATSTTDGFGRTTWYDLEAGEYWVAEQGREWCHLTSSGLSPDGNWLNVMEDQETVVKVYNCTGQPGKPGKTPTKYPNTGVPAAVREDWRLAA